jgi:hypothetical protein
MQDQVNATPEPRRVPWNKGKLTGAKPPLRPKHVWSIRTKLQIEGRARDWPIAGYFQSSPNNGHGEAGPLSPKSATS